MRHYVEKRIQDVGTADEMTAADVQDHGRNLTVQLASYSISDKGY